MGFIIPCFAWNQFPRSYWWCQLRTPSTSYGSPRKLIHTVMCQHVYYVLGKLDSSYLPILSSQAPLVGVLPLNISMQVSWKSPLGLPFPKNPRLLDKFSLLPTPSPKSLATLFLGRGVGWTGAISRRILWIYVNNSLFYLSREALKGF